MAVLDSLLENLKDYTQKLDEVAEGGYDLENWLVLYATTHLLQVHAQAFIDIVQTLLANMGQNVDGYRESVRKLRELGLINDEEMRFALALVASGT